MDEKTIATKPHIVEGGNGGKWYLYFSVRDDRTGKLKPFKIEKGFGKCCSVEEKRELGRKMIREYSEKLRKGWTPWNDEEKIYEDQIIYKNEALRFGARRKARGTVRMFASDFLLCKKKELKAKTYSSYQSKIRIFGQWLDQNNYGEYDVSAITNRIILNFFSYLTDERDLDKVTVKMYKIKIHAFFDYLIKIKRLHENPVVNIPEVRKKKDDAPKQIFRNDLQRILTEIQTEDPQLYLACMFQFYCAVRPGTELRLLKIKNIDFWGDVIMINQIDSKTGRTEGINIPHQLKDLITNKYHLQNYNPEMYVFSRNGMPGHIPLGMNSMRNRFNRIRDYLGMSQDYKYYSLKHTGAGMLMDAGFNIVEIMNHLRHTDIESTYHYIRKHKGVSSERIKNNFPDPY